MLLAVVKLIYFDFWWLVKNWLYVESHGKFHVHAAFKEKALLEYPVLPNPFTINVTLFYINFSAWKQILRKDWSHPRVARKLVPVWARIYSSGSFYTRLFHVDMTNREWLQKSVHNCYAVNISEYSPWKLSASSFIERFTINNKKSNKTNPQIIDSIEFIKLCIIKLFYKWIKKYWKNTMNVFEAYCVSRWPCRSSDKSFRIISSRIFKLANEYELKEMANLHTECRWCHVKIAVWHLFASNNYQMHAVNNRFPYIPHLKCSHCFQWNPSNSLLI